jgi:hypothetical protein
MSVKLSITAAFNKRLQWNQPGSDVDIVARVAEVRRWEFTENQK